MAEPGKTLLQRVLDGLIARRRWVLVFAALVTLLAWFPARRLEFDQSIESLYAQDDPHLTAFLESRRLFGGDEFLIVAWSEPELFAENGRELRPEIAQDIERFAEQLSQVPGIRAESTQDLASALTAFDDLGPIVNRLFRKLRSRLQVKTIEMSEGLLLGPDHKTTSIVLRLEPLDAPGMPPRGDTYEQIRELAAAHDPPARVVGEPLQVHDMFRYVEEDGRVLFYVSLVLLGGVIFIFFRSLRWVALPLAVVLATILWTEAALVLSGLKLSMVSSMLNSLVTIIGVATVTHVTVRFREYRETLDRVEAFRQAVHELAMAIVWTCGTTAAGFGALLISEITPVRSFALMMAVATLTVLLASALILPGGSLIGRFSIDPRNAPAEAALVRTLGCTTEWVERHPRGLMAGAALIVAFSAAGLFRLKVETDFSKNFRDSSDIVQSLRFVESRLGGAGTWEVNFDAPKTLDDEYLDKVRDLAARLRKELGGDAAGRLTKVIALTDGLDLIPQIPIVASTIRERLDLGGRMQPEFETSLYNAEQGRMRIVLRSIEQQSAEEKTRLMNAVESLSREQFPDARVTGLFVLLTFLIDSLMSDQLTSFLLAAGGILIMMVFAFRSLALGLISLVPNLFPIVLVVGTMGWIGLPINIATAMIASVSMGLTVDSSIHYLTAYLRERRGGASVSEALRASHQQVGRALVFANVALIVGFSVLTWSHFIPLVYFGILVSVAMLGGLLGNLMLLPLLLKAVDREEMSTSRAD